MTESGTGLSWELWCDRAQYQELRKDPVFPSLLALARVVNALRYHAVVLLACENDPTPSGTRQRLTSFLYSAATLHEALLLVHRLGKVFRGVPAFDSRLALIFRDPIVQELEGGLLARFRNDAVYHFQEATFEEALPILEEAPRHVFAAGKGWRNADVYYGLADLLVFHYAVYDPADQTDFADRFKAMIQKVTTAVLRLGDDADHLITDRLAAMRWQRSVSAA